MMVLSRSPAARAARILARCAFYVGMIFLILPIVVVVISSFTAGDVVSFPPQGWSTRWYGIAAGRQDFLSSLWLTLVLAVVVTFISLVLGLITALTIVRGRYRGRGALSVAALAPLFVPNVVIGFAALPVMAAIGLLGSIWAVLIAYVIIVFPMIVRALIGTIESLNSSTEEAARVFGATPLRAFLTVTLPLAARGIFAGAIFSFVAVLDEAVIIAFIGGTNTVTFPMRLFSYIAETYDPVASVFATLMIVATTALMLVLDRLIGFERLGSNR
ncbi:ABC transporter permease [Chelatococcus asaccharovorans]|uniref:Putative spermidine/putrescine transport system permease protein n=1 Tax=Chelatococcus asaccharovorans TaxID=28210 RepID=A0A2V3TTV7_9HYPH|nr:ABC transporter permease [Chelatococcus asaccharovorans]MBS7704999.1 ABC transporter permease [Chelatococcus asaccharovorans]PXW51914.1 putative spermidine/putrescine transport system permease protein [Chelatococcus asaccharovorans]